MINVVGQKTKCGSLNRSEVLDQELRSLRNTKQNDER